MSDETPTPLAFALATVFELTMAEAEKKAETIRPMLADGAFSDERNWFDRDEHTCGCVFWRFQHPSADEHNPWTLI